MLTTEILQEVFGRAEYGSRAIFNYTDALRWRRSTIDQMVNLGLLRSTAHATVIDCDECMEGCLITPEIEVNKQTGKIEGSYLCSDEYNGGFFTFDEEQFLRWEFRLDGLAEIVAAQLGLKQSVMVIPDRVYLLGVIPIGGGPLDIFMASGLRTEEASAIIGQASRLTDSANSAVIVLRDQPNPSLWPHEIKPTVLSLAEHITWIETESRLDLGTMPDLLQTSRTSVREEQWLTVTECARLFMRDLPYLDFEHAKARVSKAAGGSKFTTNGQKRDSRRIDRASFDSWRLLQRDRDIDRED